MKYIPLENPAALSISKELFPMPMEIFSLYNCPPLGGVGGGFFYDYYLRDHLNNVRTVLTEQKDTSFYPPASLETASLATEKLYYSGEDSGRVNKNTVSGYPSDNYTSPNDYIQQLSGSGFKIGTGIY